MAWATKIRESKVSGTSTYFTVVEVPGGMEDSGRKHAGGGLGSSATFPTLCSGEANSGPFKVTLFAGQEGGYRAIPSG